MEGENHLTLWKKVEIWLTDNLTRVSFVEKYLFVHHLQIMTNAGLSIVSSLHVLSQEVKNKKLKKIITNIKSEVETGKQLSEVLARYPKIFPRIYVSMIAAGEVAGKMEEALAQISHQMKQSQQISSKVRGAMIYPLIIIIAMVGISIFVVFYILPKIMVMFDEMDVELPLATRFLIALTKFAQNYWWLVLIVIGVAVASFTRLMKISGFKHAIHSLYLRLPIFGVIIKKINLARFTLTLSSLLASTIPVVEAVRISSEVLGNVIFRDNLLAASEALKRGESLSEVLSRYPRTFPPMVNEMIMVGEQSGKMENMLSELSEYYNNEVETTMNNFTAVIEPVIILLLGLGVAGIAVAVIMPMYSLAQNI
ncbi:MAG: type II secretion system F family protein [Candidatus Magasanikbacteria bacterium]|nr:type II secretion system F family protein [Candidatus Magasanikbacteria bacterium]